jgi:hypothetical protein
LTRPAFARIIVLGEQMKRALVVALSLLPAALGADEVFLAGGGRLSGVIVERSSGSITLDVGPGRVTMPMARVVRIVSGTADLAVYRDRAAHLPPGSVTGWLALARWAEGHDLLTQARESYAHVLSLDPENAAAHRGLGHVWAGDRWATVEESYRARGYVLFEGTWVTPDERRAILEERAAMAVAERERIEAEARAREAEARARVAEAEARRAEYEPQPPGSIPLGMDYPYGGVYGGPFVGGFYDPFGPYAVAPPPPPTVVMTGPQPRRDRPPRPRADGGGRPTGGAGLIPRTPKHQP